MRFTVAQVIDAIAKNGKRKIKRNYLITGETPIGPDGYSPFTPNWGRYLVHEPENVIGGCAIGQAALNLGNSIDPMILQRSLDVAIGKTFALTGLGTYITTINDNTDLSLEEIANKLRNNLSKEDLETTIEV